MLHCTTEINNTRRARATKEKEEGKGADCGGEGERVRMRRYTEGKVGAT